MTTFKLYLANTHGQKLSGFTEINASSFTEARAEYRRQCDDKGISRSGTEILAAL